MLVTCADMRLTGVVSVADFNVVPTSSLDGFSGFARVIQWLIMILDRTDRGKVIVLASSYLSSGSILGCMYSHDMHKE